MKKVLASLIAMLLVLCSGCTKVTDDKTSSDTYSNYESASNIEIIYDEGVSAIESVVSEIDSQISQKEEAGEVTVSCETSTYVTDSSENDSTNLNEVGTQNSVIDSNVNSDEAVEVIEADVNTKGENILYYNHLTETQKEIYRFMKSAAEQMTDGLFTIGSITSDTKGRFSDIAIAFRALSSDNPQIFWLPNSYITSSDGCSIAFSYHQDGYNSDYVFTKENKEKAQEQIDRMVSILVNEANKLSSRFEKELFFHDWLCENVTYGNEGTNNCYTAYGALVRGVAVCEGYSRAMQLLCANVGIPCTVVYGYSNGEGHMWNVVNPGDGFYHLDVTWDDDAKFDIKRYAYFNLSDTEIEKDHTVFDVASPNKSYVGTDYFNIYLYECKSSYYNYFVKKNLIFKDDLTQNVQLIVSAFDKGQDKIELMYNNSNTDYESVLHQLNGLLYDKGVYVSRYSPMGNGIVLWLTNH